MMLPLRMMNSITKKEQQMTPEQSPLIGDLSICNKCGISLRIHSDKCSYNDIARHEGRNLVHIDAENSAAVLSEEMLIQNPIRAVPMPNKTWRIDIGDKVAIYSDKNGYPDQLLETHSLHAFYLPELPKESELIGRSTKFGDKPCGYALKDTSCLTGEVMEEAGKRFWDKDYVKESVEHPQHYTAHPSGVECIQIVEHMSFNIGNAMKYLWRCDYKNAKLEDLKKAVWYVQREIERVEMNPPDIALEGMKETSVGMDHREDSIPYATGHLKTLVTTREEARNIAYRSVYGSDPVLREKFISASRTHPEFLEACKAESDRRERADNDGDSNNQMHAND